MLELRNEAELTSSEVAYITDVVRGAAVRLPRDRYLVMTRENLMQLLPPGTSLQDCKGECEVEVGRKVGADYVVSGELLRFGQGLRVSVKLHDCLSAGLLASESAAGARVDDLELPVAETSWRLLTRLPGAGDGRTESRGGKVETGLGPKGGEGIVNPPTDEKGFLFIKSEPPGATIWLNGKELGPSPQQTEQMVGRYVVVAELGRLYHPARQELTLDTEGARVTLTLAEASGRLEVRSAPASAEVWLDGERVGKTPWVAERKPSGTYEVRVVAHGFLPKTATAVVRDGQPTRIDLALESSQGSLLVQSEPPGAAITLNGAATGRRAPATFEGVDAGVVTVGLALDGHADTTLTAKVERGKVAAVKGTLPAQLGQLAVTTTWADGSPCEGTLLIDGSAVGRTPWKGLLPSRATDVQVRCGDSAARDRVVVLPGERRDLALQVGGSAPSSAPVPTPTTGTRPAPGATMTAAGSPSANPYPAIGHGLFWSGLAMVGAGGALHGAAAGATSDYQSTGDAGYIDRNHALSTGAVSLYAIGGASMLTGAIIWIASPSDSEWARQHSLGVVPVGEGEGAVLSWTLSR